MSSKAVHYAGFWRRVVAYLVDISLVLTLTAPVLYLIYGHGYFSWLRNDSTLFMSYGIWDALLVRLLPLALIVWFWVRYGATPGKILTHCKVVDAQTLKPVQPRQAIARLLCYAASSLPMNLGFLWIIWDKKKQGFHDKLAGTVVLYAPEDYADVPLHELMEGSS